MINVGLLFDKSTNQNPLNRKMHYDKILGYIVSGEEEGAKLHLGSEATDKNGGHHVQPNIFTDVFPNTRASKQFRLLTFDHICSLFFRNPTQQNSQSPS